MGRKRLRTGLAVTLIAGSVLAGILQIQADTFVYRTLSVDTNHSRGGRNRELFRFSLTYRTNTNTAAALNALLFKLQQSPAPQPPLLTGSLYLDDNGQEIALASAPPAGPGSLLLVFSTSLAFTNNQTRTFLMRGDFNLTPAAVTGGWSNTAFAFHGTNGAFLQTTPSSGINLSNADTGGTGFTNDFLIWDNVVSVSTATGIPAYAAFERGNSFTLLGLKVSNTYFHRSGGAFSLNALPFTVTAADICRTLTLYLDDGNNNYGPEDSLIGLYTPATGQFDYMVQFSSPIFLNNAAPRTIWVRAEIEANAPHGTPFQLTCNASDTNFFVQINRIAPDQPWTDIPSAINNVSDTIPPGAAVVTRAVAGNQSLFLTWINPGDADLARAHVVLKAGSYPGNITDGTAYSIPLQASSAGRVTNTLLSNTGFGGGYYACLFLQDSAGNVSCSFSNTFASTTGYLDTPSIPSGISVTPTRENLEITWNHPTNGDHYGMQLKAFVQTPWKGSIFTHPSLCFTNRIIVPKSSLGITPAELDMEQVYYIGVIARDIDGNTSPNNFFNTTDAVQNGIYIRYIPFHSGGGGNSKVYRNVFRPDNSEYARILVDVPQSTNLIVKIYSISGELMKTLANRTVDPGQHEFRWFGNDSGGTVNPGVYIAHVRTGSINQTHKIVVRR